MSMITRTIVKSTTIEYKKVINGEIDPEVKALTVDGMVGDICKVCKKHEDMKKNDSILILKVTEDSDLYGCTVEEFMSVAKVIER